MKFEYILTQNVLYTYLVNSETPTEVRLLKTNSKSCLTAGKSNMHFHDYFIIGIKLCDYHQFFFTRHVFFDMSCSLLFGFMEKSTWKRNKMETHLFPTLFKIKHLAKYVLNSKHMSQVCTLW